jgi:hypothetical protein
VLVGNQGPVAPPQGIELTLDSNGGTFQLHRDEFPLFIEGLMQTPAIEDACVGPPDLLDLFQVEEALAVSQGVKGHHSNRGCITHAITLAARCVGSGHVPR